METFAKRLVKLRTARNLTQRDVANFLEVPLSTYKEWEYGRRIQGEEIYVRLAKILEVNLLTLLTGEVPQEKDELIKKIEIAAQQLNEVKAALISIV